MVVLVLENQTDCSSSTSDVRREGLFSPNLKERLQKGIVMY